MRVLFSGVPAFGHLLPLLPLAHAAQAAGHDVAFLTGAGMVGPLAPFEVVPIGPEVGALLAEVARRTGAGDPATETVPALTDEIVDQAAARAAGAAGADPGTAPGRSLNAELFAATRVDLSVDEAITAAGTHAPDVVVTETADRVGPMVAAALGVPWVEHGTLLPGVLGGAIGAAMDAVLAPRYAARGLVPAPALAVLDTFPELLHLPGRARGGDVVPLRPRPHAQPGIAWGQPVLPGGQDRPRVLLTLGTVVTDSALLGGMATAVTAAADVDVVVTMGSQEAADAAEVDRTRVVPVGFVPLEQLLEGVDLVVSAGGAGTVLAALSRGLPLVVTPFVADQPVNAAQVAAAGAGAVAGDPSQVGPLVRQVLSDPAHRAAAGRVAAQIAAMGTPEQVLATLTERLARAA